MRARLMSVPHRRQVAVVNPHRDPVRAGGKSIGHLIDMRRTKAILFTDSCVIHPDRGVLGPFDPQEQAFPSAPLRKRQLPLIKSGTHIRINPGQVKGFTGRILLPFLMLIRGAGQRNGVRQGSAEPPPGLPAITRIQLKGPDAGKG